LVGRGDNLIYGSWINPNILLKKKNLLQREVKKNPDM